MKKFFVTATGTDLGKTYVLCDLVRQLRERGKSVSCLKPVLSGFDRSAPQESDSGKLLAAMGKPVDLDSISAISPWLFKEPLSPDMAAKREGKVVTLDEVVHFCQTASGDDHDVLFVEGAGGVMSPLGHRFTNLDLVCALDFHVILVAGGYLGTISHILTACETLARRNRRLDAIVLSGKQLGPVSLPETCETIERFTDMPVICVDLGARVPSVLADLVAS